METESGCLSYLILCHLVCQRTRVLHPLRRKLVMVPPTLSLLTCETGPFVLSHGPFETSPSLETYPELLRHLKVFCLFRSTFHTEHTNPLHILGHNSLSTPPVSSSTPTSLSLLDQTPRKTCSRTLKPEIRCPQPLRVFRKTHPFTIPKSFGGRPSRLLLPSDLTFITGRWSFQTTPGFSSPNLLVLVRTHR